MSDRKEYEVRFTSGADRQLRKLEPVFQRRIAAAIDALRADPRPHDARRIVGVEDAWRIRVGAYRVVYVVRDDLIMIVVVRIGPRRDVYRGL